MVIMLGNLSVGDIEKRTEVKFSQEVVYFLNKSHSDEAEFADKNKWHCFEHCTIVCGSKEFAEKVLKMLSPYASDMKCQLGIGWN